jgi:hypothetical protein
MKVYRCFGFLSPKRTLIFVSLSLQAIFDLK